MNLSQFNILPQSDAYDLLLQSCASKKWGLELVSKRPFSSLDNLLEESEQIWKTMEREDYLEAFSAHPKIGDVKQKDSSVSSALSAHEQSSVANAKQSVLQELETKNKSYFDKFGFVFLVYATGKTAEEMLEILNTRIDNSADHELENAAAEQLKISNQRFTKLIAGPK